MHTPTIAIDFDGVIHKYSKGWQDGSIYDEVIEGTENALKKLAEDFYITIFSTRNAKEIVKWLEEKGLIGYVSEVTDKKPLAKYYIDDRAIRFTDWSDAVQAVRFYEEDSEI